MPDKKPLGKVVTFYSYKGGTGRSMALANVAWLLALSGRSVVTIDWDLEAPGLHRYFHPFMDDPSQASTEGLLDFVIRLADIASGETDLATRPGSYFADHARLDSLIEPLDCDFLPSGGEIGFIGPGRQGPAYSQQLGMFNWHQFYSKLRGRQFLDAAMIGLRAQYDYVLIDSRTGMSDTAGICTVHLPDQLVVCFTLNEQSIAGASAVANHVRAQRADDEREKRFRVLPVACRVENSEKEKKQTALAYARQMFSGCFAGTPESEQETYWGQTQLPYVPFYAFEEIPAVFGDDPRDELSLMAPTRRVAAYIAGKEWRRDTPLETARRKTLLQLFLRSPERAASAAAEELVQRVSADRGASIRSAVLRLINVEEGVPHSLRRVNIRAFPPRTEDAIRDLQQAGVVLVAREANGDEYATLRDASLLDNWPRLAEWIQEDMAFLVRRQNLDRATVAWLQSGEDAASLLRGPLLVDAEQIVRTHQNDLNAQELQFVATSRAAQSRSEAETQAADALSWLHTRLVSLSAAGAIVALVLLPLTLFAVFYVSAPSIALVETTMAHRAAFERAIGPDRVAQLARATAKPAGTPARKGNLSATERRRDERERGLAALATRLLTVSLAGLPFLPGLEVDAAFLVAVLIGAGAPLLMMCSILFVRRMIAWRAVQPFGPLSQSATNGEEATYTAQILRPRIRSRAQAFGYHDPLGTPLLGTPGGVACLAIGSLVALSLYTSVLAYMAWRGTTLSPVPLAASLTLSAAAIIAAWFYVRRQPLGVRILAADTDADERLV